MASCGPAKSNRQDFLVIAKLNPKTSGVMTGHAKSFSFGGLVAFVLTVATWIFFYEWNLPLDVASTTVAFAGWFALAVAGQWIWLKIRNARGKSRNLPRSEGHQ